LLDSSSRSSVCPYLNGNRKHMSDEYNDPYEHIRDLATENMASIQRENLYTQREYGNDDEWTE